MLKQRLAWMDLLRGTAILLVIANHAIHSDQQAIAEAPHWLVQVNDLLAPLRMPVVVFLSGLLVSESLRKPPRVYLEGKMRNIAWPFLVWSLVGYCWVAAVLHLRGDPQRDVSLLDFFVRPFNHLWFLEYLFVIYLVALVTRRINPLWISAAAVLASFLVEDKPQRFVLLLACFMAGAWFSRHPDLFAQLVRRRGVLMAAVATLVALVVLHTGGFDVRSNLRYEPQSLPFVAAALVLVGRGAMAVADQRWTGPIRHVGRFSLVYYVTHGYPVEMGAWAAVVTLGTGVAPVAAGFTAGLLSGVVMAWGHPRFRVVNALYSFPRRRSAPRHRELQH